MVFKIALIPVWIALAALKVMLAVVAGIVLLVLVGPVVLAIGIALFIPLLLVGGVIAAGVALVS